MAVTPRRWLARLQPGHWLRYLLWLLLTVFLLVQLWFLGWVLYLRNANPGTTHFMALRLAELQARQPDAVLRQTWVPYRDISPQLKRALIAAEDGKFNQHSGFDWHGIQKAIERNEKRGRTVSGGSTITQQLAKNLFLSPERSWLRKGQEAIITVMLELCWDKTRILEVYLNIIEWGNGVFGAEAAARHYFNTSAARLDTAQAARLAAMVPAPRYYDRHRQTPGLERRTAIILERQPAARLP